MMRPNSSGVIWCHDLDFALIRNGERLPCLGAANGFTATYSHSTAALKIALQL
jgi:hypothetical protein